MLGVIVNVITVLLGSCIGLLFKKGIPEKVSTATMIGLGACTLYIGISGSLCGENVLIVIASVVLGVISGTLLNIDGAINKLAKSVEERFKKDGQNVSIAEGLVTATLLFCVGSMTVTGSIQAGLTGDNSVLITKATLDLVSSMMLASSLGVGVLLASVSVFAIQGGLVLLAGLIAPFMSTLFVEEDQLMLLDKVTVTQRITIFGILGFCCASIVCGVFVAVGKTKLPIIINGLRIVGFRYPIIIIANALFDANYLIIPISTLISNNLVLLVSFYLYFKKIDWNDPLGNKKLTK